MKSSVNKGNGRVYFENQKGRMSSTARLVITVAILLVVCIYIGGILFFRGHYFPKTEINGIVCGGKSVASVQVKIATEAASYVLALSGRDGLTDNISADEISLKPVFDDGLDEILKEQKIILWPIVSFLNYNYEVSTVLEYDESAFEKKVSGLVFCQKKNQKMIENAYLSDITEDGYVIVPEVQGSIIKTEALKSAISDAVLTLADTLDLDKVGCYEEPEITSNNADLVAECDKLNRFVQTKITYKFGEEIVETTPEIIAEWITYDEHGNISLVQENVREFVNDIARKYDTFGKRRNFVTHTGESIEITEGTYGWWMNRVQETDELMELIASGVSQERTPVYYATAAQYGATDWGDSYVEIDLSEQHLYLYLDGKLNYQSDFVSGNVARNFATPRGIYGITYKERNATLAGQGYNSEVKYWMPFNNNVGMHDASWRKSFGGDIYLTNGSHGCINLPQEAAEYIYEHIEQNTPVIVYGGAEYVKKPSPAESMETGIEEQPDGTVTQDVVIPDTSDSQDTAMSDTSISVTEENVMPDADTIMPDSIGEQ